MTAVCLAFNRCDMGLEQVHRFCGLAAAAVFVGADITYTIDIVRGRTRPSRATWWVFALLNGAIAASYLASGARETVWLPAAYAFGFLITALLSLWYGDGDWALADAVCLGGAILGIAAWCRLRSPQLALAVLVVVDLFGMIPTFRKAWARPWTESTAAWIVGTLASALNVLAIGKWSVIVAAYPIYVFVTNAVVVGFILRPRLPRTSIIG